MPPAMNLSPTPDASMTARTGAPRILSAGAVRVSRDRLAVGAPLDDVCQSTPKVQVRQRNGVVAEIVVTCGCGQQTVLECDYSDSGTGK
jgi:hypothetical protein